MRRLISLALLVLASGCVVRSPVDTTVTPKPPSHAEPPTERLIACETVISLGASIRDKRADKGDSYLDSVTALGSGAAARTEKNLWVTVQMPFQRWQGLSDAEKEKLTRAAGRCTDWNYGLVMNQRTDEFPTGRPLGQILGKSLAQRYGLPTDSFIDYTKHEEWESGGWMSSPAPAITNGWVRNPADDFAAAEAGLWVVEDKNHSLGESLRTPFAYSTAGGKALITTDCGVLATSGLIVFPGERFVWFGYLPRLAVKVGGVRYSLPVEREIGEHHFFMGHRGNKLFRRAIREELPVKLAVPIFQVPGDVINEVRYEVFEWDMKGGAVAWEVTCRP